MIFFKLIFFITFSATSFSSNIYSVAGSGDINDFKFLIKEIGINTFEIDLPWKNYHKKRTSEDNTLPLYYFDIDKNLENILNEIRSINGKVLIQISTHYTPTWVLQDFPSVLLKDYRGRNQVNPSESYQSLVSPYAFDFQETFIVPWIEFISKYLKENFDDIIIYINPSILEEGQLSYPWSGNDGEELVFWAHDRFFLKSYKQYLKNKFSNNLEKLNKYYLTNFKSWDSARPLRTSNERHLYSDRYYEDFVLFYKKGLLDISQLYSSTIKQYFLKDKLIIKIPLWHRGLQNERTYTESRFVHYYLSNLNNYYKNILFLPLQDLDNLTTYITHGLNLDYNILLEATKKVGDYNNVDFLIHNYNISGINFINFKDLVQDPEMQRYYKNWINTLENKREK